MTVTRPAVVLRNRRRKGGSDTSFTENCLGDVVLEDYCKQVYIKTGLGYRLCLGAVFILQCCYMHDGRYMVGELHELLKMFSPSE